MADTEAFMANIPAVPEGEENEHCPHCHLTSEQIPCITFMPEDMQVKGKYDRPLYYTEYIGSSVVDRIQVDPGSALSIMPRRVLQHLGMPTHKLSATQMTIYGFNANGSRPLGKIRKKCQIRDLKS